MSDILDVENVRHSRSWECQTFSIFFLPPNLIICIPFDAKLCGDTEYCIRIESWLFYKEILRVYRELRECQTFSTFMNSDENVRHSQLPECQTFSTFRMSDILDFQNVWHSQLRECQTFSTCRMHDYLAQLCRHEEKIVFPPWGGERYWIRFLTVFLHSFYAASRQVMSEYSNFFVLTSKNEAIMKVLLISTEPK